MRKYYKDFLLLTFLCFTFYYVVRYNYLVSERIEDIFFLWLKKIVPTILPTFLIIDLFFNSSIPYLFNKYLHFNPIYIFSIISGSPSNAYLLKDNNMDIEKNMAVTKYTGLVFSIVSLKQIFNLRIAIVLLFFNFLSSFILFLIIKPSYKYIPRNHTSFINCVVNSVRNSSLVLVNILFWILIFNIMPFYMINNQLIKGFVYSLFEITCSFNYLQYANLCYPIKILFTIISISTCGLCISMQMKSIIADTLFNYRKYLMFRLLHLVIYLLLGLFLII